MADSIKERPIGVFDSGVGGISVLGRMIKDLPLETFIYLADHANAPYGIKDYKEVLKLSVKAANTLLEMNIKALVVACNTATSVAINTIRGMTDIPVIGMEPAVKPAVQMCGDGTVAVMATPLTLKEEKFNNLLRKFDANTQILPLPCPGLVELIESEASSAQIVQYLKGLFDQLSAGNVSTVVLGCTHYSFIKKQIFEAMGREICVVDGREGTTRHLKNMLEAYNLAAESKQNSVDRQVHFMTTQSTETALETLTRFFEKSLMDC